MSTSRSREAPIAYMSPDGQNVMWSLHPQVESDTAYHYGADISGLSQFGEEKEVLYPPCTMLQVERVKASKEGTPDAHRTRASSSSPGEGKGGSAAIGELLDSVGAKAQMVKEDDKLFLSVDVLPRYV